MRLYQGEARPMADIDILVEPSAQAEAGRPCFGYRLHASLPERPTAPRRRRPHRPARRPLAPRPRRARGGLAAPGQPPASTAMTCGPGRGGASGAARRRQRAAQAQADRRPRQGAGQLRPGHLAGGARPGQAAAGCACDGRRPADLRCRRRPPRRRARAACQAGGGRAAPRGGGCRARIGARPAVVPAGQAALWGRSAAGYCRPGPRPRRAWRCATCRPGCPPPDRPGAAAAATPVAARPARAPAGGRRLGQVRPLDRGLLEPGGRREQGPAGG